jgi:hypothetical protein
MAIVRFEPARFSQRGTRTRFGKQDFLCLIHNALKYKNKKVLRRIRKKPVAVDFIANFRLARRLLIEGTAHSDVFGTQT